MVELKQRYHDLRGLPLFFQLGPVRGRVLGFGMHRPTWWRNFLHTHSYYEVCAAFQGRGYFQHQAVHHEVSTGDLFVALPQMPHEIIASESDPLGIFYWSFTLEERDDLQVDRPWANTLDAWRQRHDGSVVVSAPHLLPLFDLISAELNQGAPGYTFALQALCHKLQIDLLRAFAGNTFSESGVAPASFDAHTAIVNEVQRFLNDNFHRQLRLRDVAAQLYLSERHINRLFKRHTGRTIMQQLTYIRLAQAKRLLLDPTCTIGEVAHQVGLADVRYFATLFRKHTGQTPTLFRQQRGTQTLS